MRRNIETPFAPFGHPFQVSGAAGPEAVLHRGFAVADIAGGFEVGSTIARGVAPVGALWSVGA